MDGSVRAVRLVTAIDGMGFSMSDVRIAGGTEQDLWYKHHWEANYIVSGRLTVTDKSRERRWELGPGDIYNVGPHDPHHVTVHEPVRLLAIFNPPITGEERHDADGAYPPTGPLPPGREQMFIKSVAELRTAGREMVVAGGSAHSVRALLAEDGLGFTVCEVRLGTASRNVLWYKHHWEANYILDGEGEVEDLASGERWTLSDGTLYCVGPADRHAMRAHTNLRLLSVFCPALHGNEQHDEEGTLAASGPIPPGPQA